MDYRSSLLAVEAALLDAGIVMSASEVIKVTDSLVRRNANFTEDGPDYSTHEGRVTAVLSSGVIMGYMKDGKKINAIKELRTRTGCGLKEAKDAVEDQRVVNMSGYRPSWDYQ